MLLENLHKIIHRTMKENNIPGAALAVIKDNQVILSQGYGSTTVEKWGSPISDQTLFRIASVSKLFTGTLIMMLVEKGLIDLDRSVQSYIPWFTTANEELSKIITVRMLLSHSSGLPTGGELSFRYKENGLEHYMKEIVPTLPTLFYPGTAYSYGNHSLNIAGFVAEQVTNKPFEELMKDLVFGPLDMNQTTYNPLKAMTHPLAMPHDKDENGALRIAQQFYDNSASYPSYYSFSSIHDLTQFAMLHLQDGEYSGRQLLFSSSIKEMRKQQSKWYTVTDAGCGITFFQENKDGFERFWHYGQYSHQYSSQFILVPEKGIAVIALANGENIFQAGYEIVDELLKEEKVEAQTVVKSMGTVPDWSFFAGSYLHSYYGLVKIIPLDERSILEHNGQRYDLQRFNEYIYLAKHLDGNTVFTVGFPVMQGGQTIKSIMVNSKACPEFKKGYVANSNDWIDWVGHYSDGKESYDVLVEEGTLVINALDMSAVANAIDKNAFLTKEYGLVSFRNINGVITMEFDHAWRYAKQD